MNIILQYIWLKSAIYPVIIENLGNTQNKLKVIFNRRKLPLKQNYSKTPSWFAYLLLASGKNMLK